jgi:hypothetical protein
VPDVALPEGETFGRRPARLHTQLDSWRVERIPLLEDRLGALDTWSRWANGDTINVEQLGDAVHTLLEATGEVASRYHVLGQTLQHWVTDAGVRRTKPDSAIRTLEVAGPELGLWRAHPLGQSCWRT